MPQIYPRVATRHRFETRRCQARGSAKFGANRTLNSRDAGALSKAVGSFDLLLNTTNVGRCIPGPPIGSPATVDTVLEFCARHSISPVTENFPLSRVNEALEHVRSGETRYRVVLQNDLAA